MTVNWISSSSMPTIYNRPSLGFCQIPYHDLTIGRSWDYMRPKVIYTYNAELIQTSLIVSACPVKVPIKSGSYSHTKWSGRSDISKFKLLIRSSWTSYSLEPTTNIVLKVENVVSCDFRDDQIMEALSLSLVQSFLQFFLGTSSQK